MRLLREPLLHWVLLALALFATYRLTAEFRTPVNTRVVQIDAAEIDFLAATFSRQWNRQPTEEELRAMVRARTREEVLYREALQVGLDRNDGVVRRRMVQKMELLTQDLALLVDPTDAELRTFLEEHRSDYLVPPRLSFRHVYYNADRRGPAVEQDALRDLAVLESGNAAEDTAEQRGDPFMLGHEFALRDPDNVRRMFGNRFADELFEFELGWHGPIVSGYGLHLVEVSERIEAREPELQDIRERLISAVNRARVEQAGERLFEGLLGQYEVEIDEDAIRATLAGE